MSTTEDADKEKEKKEEPLFEMLENPARALPAQVYVLTFFNDHITLNCVVEGCITST